MKLSEGVKPPADFELTQDEIQFLILLCKHPPSRRFVRYYQHQSRVIVGPDWDAFNSPPEIENTIHLLEARGILRELIPKTPPNSTDYMLQETRLKDFKQLDELRVQLALGTLKVGRL